MNFTEYQALELELESALVAIGRDAGCLHKPITDGVVHYPTYIESSPKILWILKEPWEVLETEEVGGGWNVAREAPALLLGHNSNKGALAMMAYISYAISNGLRRWQDVPSVSDSPEVAKSLARLGYINVSKFPGAKTSEGAMLAQQYGRYRDLLHKQIQALSPDVIIGGSTLWLFLDDLGIRREMFDQSMSAHYLRNHGRLYIDAYHPAQWSAVKPEKYFGDIVEIIFRHFPPFDSAKAIAAASSRE